MAQVELGDVSLHYEISGPADASVLVLSNSRGTTMDMWHRQLPALERHFQVLRYDMRGHGRSSTPAGPCSIDQLGRDAIALLETLEIERANFCGLSLGGMIGQWLAANAPHRLIRLILCNTAAAISTEATWNSRIDAVLTGGMAAIADSVVERWFTSAFRANQPAAVSQMRAMLAATDPKGYVAACAAIRDMDQRSTAASIKCATLIIAGECDSVTSIADASFRESSIRGAKLAVLPAAHVSNIEASGQFNEVVVNFLADASE